MKAWIKRVGLWGVAGLFTAGILFWGAFNWAFEVTNTEQFCVSCHEMQVNVFSEYRHTGHYSNRSGVRATCPDCHVPKEWGPKIVRKIQASNELWHKLVGSVDTPEKFQAKRLQLAESEWRRMKANDSQECRNCHKYDYMDFGEQGRRAVRTHSRAFDEGKTCIECHRGVAHQLPPIEQEIGAPKALQVRAP
jgi:cytochrome c-type protein NapC